MPNPGNIESPVCLVAPRRSGTTLITSIFRQHPEFQSLGETAPLIHTAYELLTGALRFCGPIPNEFTVPEAARLAVHGIFLNVYPSPRPRWFMKPIGVPGPPKGVADFGAWAASYWQNSRYLFPHGRVFTVLRNPADVLASSMQRWGWSEEQAKRKLLRNYQLLLHAQSRIEFVVDFDRLVSDSEATVRGLLQFAGADFQARCLNPFRRRHASNPSGPEGRSGLKPGREIMTSYNHLLKRA